MITKAQAIKSLDANSEFSIRNDIITWHTTPITDAEIATEMARLQGIYDSQEYARARATEYAALNQFEMQFDDQQNNTTTWVDAINDIKARHPKS